MSVTAAELNVRIKVEYQEAQRNLMDMHALIQRLGAAKLPDDLQRSITSVGTASTSTADAVRKLGESQQQLRIDGATTSFQNFAGKLDIAKQRLAELTAKYGENATQTRNAALAVETLQSKLGTASGAVQLAKDKLELLRNTEQSLTPTTKNLATEIEVLANSGGKFSAFGEVAVGALRRVGESIISNLLPAIGGVISIGSEYQSSMAMFGAVSGASSEQMAAAALNAKALGANLTLPATSASGAANAMTELAKAGLSADEAMAASLGTLQLSAAGMITEAEAAQYTASALNAFNLEGSEATRIADLLAASVAASGSSVQQTGMAMQQAGAVYAAAGVPIEDMVVLINELSASGLKGSDAGTSLKTMLMALQNPSKEAAGEMKNLNISLYDAQGAMRPMKDVIGDFASATAGLTQQQKDGALATIFGSDAVRAANIVIRNGADGFDAFAEKTRKGGDAGLLAGAQMAGLGGAVKGLQSQLETAALNGIEPLLPLFTNVITKLSEFAGWLASNIGPAVTDFVAGLKLVYDVGKMTFDWIATNATAILTAIELTLGGVVATFILFNAGLAVTAITGVAASVSLGSIAFGLGAVAINALAALAPFAALAIAIGGIALAGAKFQEVKEQIVGGTAEMLNQEVFWTKSSAAIDEYSKLLGGASVTTTMAASTTEDLRQKITDLTEAHVARAAAGGFSEQGEKDSIANIQVYADKLKESTAALEKYTATDRESNVQAAASVQGLRGLRDEYGTAAEGVTVLTEAFQATPEAIEKADKAIKAATDGGIKAFDGLIGGRVAFQNTTEDLAKNHEQKLVELQNEFNTAKTDAARAGISEKIAAENEAYSASQTNAALNYAQLEAQQQASLGRMIIEWVNAQAMINPAFSKVSAELIAATEVRYGIMASASEKGLGETLGHYTDYANGVITSTADLNIALDATEQKYTTVANAADSIRKDVVSTIQAKWESGSYGADPETAFALYQADLANVEKTVQSKVEVVMADAEANLQRVQATTDRMDRKIDIAINGESTNAVNAANSANKAIVSIPKQTYLAFKDDAIASEGRVKTLTSAITSVPKTTATYATFYGGGAVGQATAVGAEMANGVAAGIASRAAAVAGAMMNSVSGAIAAAKAAAGIRSPSQVTSSIIGAPLAEGIAEGVKSKGVSVSDALTGIVGKGVGDATLKAAEGIGKIAETVSVAVDALNKLKDFEQPSGNSIIAMADSLQFMVETFAARVVGIEPVTSDAIKAYTDVTSSILGVITEGADAFAALDEFTGVDSAVLLTFIDAIAFTVNEFSARANETNSELFDVTTKFAETAGVIVGIIGDGVAAFEALKGFAPVAEVDIALFSLAIRDVVRQFGERTKELNTDLFETTNAFVEVANASVGTIVTGIEAFSKLSTFTGVPEAALSAFADGLRLTVALMIQIAAEFDASGVEAAAAFADSAGRVIAPISAGVDAFTKLKDYAGVAPGVMQLLFADIQTAIALMIQIAATADTEGVKAAAAFSDSISKVFDGLSSGISALDAMRDYESVPQERMGAVLGDMTAAIDVIRQLAGLAQSAASEGETWKAALELFATNIKAGIDALSGLAGLGINISASVSASAGGSEGGSEGGATAGADGSHALGLDRVPSMSRGFYKADLHAGERVLTKENADRQDELFSILATMSNGGSMRTSAPENTTSQSGGGTSQGQSGGGKPEIHLHVYSPMDVNIVAHEIMEIMERS